MKRKNYERPTMKVVQLKLKCQILAASSFETTGASINMMGQQTDL